jgi:hypothetical protein
MTASEKRRLRLYPLGTMPRKSAPVRNTSGKGFNFADDIAARLMIQMLARDYPFEVEVG